MTRQAKDTPYPNYIKEHIKQRGYTIREVADKVGIPRRTLSDYVTGKRPVPRENLKKLARYLKCSLNELIAEPVQTSLFMKKRENQGTSSTSLIENHTSPPLELGNHNMDVLRREILQQVLGATGATLVLPLHHALNFVEGSTKYSPPHSNKTMSNADTEEFLVQCAASITACWYLMRGNQLAVIDTLLSTYIQKLNSLVQHSSKYKEAASILITQAYRQYGILALHKNDLNARELYCQYAAYYSEMTENANLQVSALISLASTFYYNQDPQKATLIYQKALVHQENISPLLLSRLYVELAVVYAQQQRIQEALRYMGLAKEIYPNFPENDASFLYAEFSPSSMILEEGLTYLALAQQHSKVSKQYLVQARETFARIENSQVDFIVPERIRIEIINHQAKAAIALKELENFCSYLEIGANGAKKLDSQKRREEGITIYREARNIWPNEVRIKELADLFL